MSVLAGLRVVDLSLGHCAALTASLLADCGADVIKMVDSDPRVTADPVDADWMVANRGKRLGTFVSVNDLSALISDCHVIVADSREVLRRFGLDAATTGTRVTLFVSPLDDDGAPWAGFGDSPAMLTALSGLAVNQSSYSGRPVDTVYPYLRYAQAAWAAACALAALVERQSSGYGQLVTVSGWHTANLFCCILYGRPLSELSAPRPDGPGGINPVYTRYRGSDGRWFFVGGLGPKFARAVLDLAGAAYLLDDPRVGGRLDQLWAPDNSGWVMATLTEIFQREPAGHWMTALEAAGIPGALVASRQEWFASEQVTAGGQRQDLVDPVLGPLRTAGAPLWFDGVAAPARPASAVVPGTELGWTQPDTWAASPGVTAPDPGRGPLHGLRVASLGSFVAGPYVGSLLARLGADVVKIEPLAGDPWRLVGFSYNQGVRSLAVDLHAPEGREAAGKVLSTCDVVIDNFRLGVTDRLGMSHQALNADGLTTATVAVTAYGEVGPLAELPGYDSVAQAASGIMLALGGEDEPVLSSLPNVDHTTAAVGALGACAALLHLVRENRAVHVTTSLAATAVYLQTPELTDFANRGPARIGGRDFAGPGPLDRIYPVADGFVRLQVERLDAAAWAQAGLDLDVSADTEAAVTGALAGLTRSDAVTALTAAGVRAVAVRGSSEVVNDPALVASGVQDRLTGADDVQFGLAGRFAAYSRTDQQDLRPAPGLGEHSRQILADAGVSAAEADALEAGHHIVCGGPLAVIYSRAYR